MTKRDFAVDTIKEIVKGFGRNAVNDRKDIYRSRMILDANVRLSDDEDNDLMIGKIVISEFFNGLHQMAFEVCDLHWRAFSACDDNYIINVAYRLCKKYNLTDKLLELCDFCGYGFLVDDE